MEISNLKEAKKYIDKIIWTASDYQTRGKYKVIPLYIGGINLFFNRVTFDIEGFAVWGNRNYSKYYGSIEKKRIGEIFDPKKRNEFMYFLSQYEAIKYCEWLQRDKEEREKEYDVENAKELLNKHKVKFEIFD